MAKTKRTLSEGMKQEISYFVSGSRNWFLNLSKVKPYLTPQRNEKNLT